jgi:hypothetical protein
MIRKYLLIIIVALLLVAGCSEQQPPMNLTPTGTAAETPEPTAETPATTGEPSPEPTGTAGAGAWIPDGIISDGEYPQSQEFGGGAYTLYWRTDGEEFQMAMAADVTGWVAVGFEPTSRMKDADIIFGWVEDGTPRILDMFSTGETGPHPPDTDLGGTEDIFEFGGAETDGTTVIEFSRKMDTGDSYDKAFEPGQTVAIIWGTADSDVPSFKHNTGKGTGEFTFEG